MLYGRFAITMSYHIKLNAIALDVNNLILDNFAYLVYNIYVIIKYACVAQLVAQLIRNQ